MFERRPRPAITGSSSLGRPQGGGVDYRAVRELVSMQQVLELLNWAPVSRRGVQLRGPCPIHQSSDPSSRTFSVNLERSIFQCWKPGCGGGNQLDLYAAVTGLPIYAATCQLCERLGIEPPHRSPTT